LDILKASLSVKGVEMIRGIMRADRTLSEINDGSPFLDEELYFITIMGSPSKT
jgi:hypothetical protein